jgi:hypothetical protein
VPAFLHHRRQSIEKLLGTSTSAFVAHADGSFQLEQIVADFLDEAVATYRALGAAERENEMVALRAEVVEAHRGVNPLTLERTSTHRRDMQRGIALHVLRVSGERLRTDHATTGDALSDLRSQLTPLAAYSLQAGMVPAGEVTPAEVEHAWKLLSEDPQSSAAVRRVEMSFSSIDVHLVFGDLLALSR